MKYKYSNTFNTVKCDIFLYTSLCMFFIDINVINNKIIECLYIGGFLLIIILDNVENLFDYRKLVAF
jgi:hypothetical protein